MLLIVATDTLHYPPYLSSKAIHFRLSLVSRTGTVGHFFPLILTLSKVEQSIFSTELNASSTYLKMSDLLSLLLYASSVILAV
jgi:hypothetical protein